MRRRIEPIRIEHRPLSRDYAPRYPATLAPEEYRAFVTRRTHDRARALVASAAFVVLQGTTAPEQGTAPKEEPRERRVLEILEGLARSHRSEHGWFWRSSAFRAKEEDGITGLVYLPQIPISFGNSISGLFDAGTARQIATKLFAAYGIDHETDVDPGVPGVRGQFDCVDVKRRVGVKLSGMFVPDEETGEPRLDAEPETLDFSAEERTALKREGWKLHIAPRWVYRIADGDELTPMLAYLTGLVEFLNSVTDGPDLDVRAILMGDVQSLPVADLDALGLELSRGVGHEAGNRPFELRAPKTIVLRFAGAGSPPVSVRPRGRLSRSEASSSSSAPRSTLGCVSALQVPILARSSDGSVDTSEARVRARLHQSASDGAAAVDLSANTTLLFTPSRFDAARAFEIEVELQPGRYELGAVLDVTCLRP